jgi:5-bromo-4-chloroindolyl phosphate hydrolysis protein
MYFSWMKRNDALREAMKKSIAFWRESGKSQKAWCKEEGISLSKFKYWIKQLENSTKKGKQISKSDDKKLIPLKVTRSTVD